MKSMGETIMNYHILRWVSVIAHYPQTKPAHLVVIHPLFKMRKLMFRRNRHLAKHI